MCSSTRNFLIFILSIFCCNSATGQQIQVFDFVSDNILDSVYITDIDGVILEKRLNNLSVNDLSKYKEVTLTYENYYPSEPIQEDNLIGDNIRIGLEPKNYTLNAMVAYGIKSQNSKLVSQHKFYNLTNKQIAYNMPATMADALDVGEVFIQKSQQGGGSPMLRGFAANSVLIVVDGIRMNNAIFRSGNLQNVIAVDPNMVQEANVILGPGSILYGSDALGGVLSIQTDVLNTSDDFKVKPELGFEYASATESKSSFAKTLIQHKKWSSLTAFSYSDFGDVKMGKYGPNEYLSPVYVENLDGIDSLMINSNHRIQRNSGYSQKNFMQKLLFEPNNHLAFKYKFSHSETSNIPRYDRLIQPKDDGLKYANWYYGPSIWQVHSLQTNLSYKTKLFDEWESIISYQKFKESRNDRKFNASVLRERFEKVSVLGIEQNFSLKLSSWIRLNYGLDGYFNKVESMGLAKDMTTLIEEPIASRYPNNSKYYNVGSFAHLAFRLNPKTKVSIGGRLNFVHAYADLSDALINLPFSEAHFDTYAFSGSVNLKRTINNSLTLNTSLSSGFRAPNIDDLAKIFDSEPGSVVVPNPNIKPEYLYAFETNLNYSPSNRFKANLTGYVSYLDDALVRGDFKLNGKSMIEFDGEPSRVQTLQNAASATIYGSSLNLSLNIIDHLNLRTSFNYIHGKDKLINGSKQPRRHVAPTNARGTLTYKKAFYTISLSSKWNHEIAYEDLAPSEVNKAYLYAKDNNGNPFVPSFIVFDLKSKIQIAKDVSIMLGIDNFFDVRYRPYSSGISAPGRSFNFGLNWSLN